LVTSIEAVFGKAGVEMEKFIRTMNFWYIYQDFSGLFPFPKWCGLPDNQIPSTTSLFLGVCSSRMARIAFRYFLVFRHVTRKGMYYTFIEYIWYNKIY